MDSSGDFDVANQSFSSESTEVATAGGRCRLARPNIGDLLPVYVYDEYAGFNAKRFVDLDQDEIDRYVSTNVDALRTAIATHRPQAIFVNHEVMGPYIAKLATEGSLPFVVMLHGSALEYVVGVDDRFVPYAEEGLGAAKAVVGGSHYMVERASNVVAGWRDKAVVVNPGTDVELFSPAEEREVDAPIAGFVGKLITAKGPQNLLAAIGLTRTPDLRTVFVGYGGFQDEMRELAALLQRGRLDAARDLAVSGDGRPLEHVLRFLERLEGEPEDVRRAYLQRMAEVPVEFTGRLEHGPLSKTLPGWDVLVVPSVVPEAFGMVAAEAAASGVMPVVPAHSGIGEAGAAVERALGRPGFLTYDPVVPVEGIAEALDRVLAVPRAERREMGRIAADLAHATWSWERVGERLLEVAG